MKNEFDLLTEKIKDIFKESLGDNTKLSLLLDKYFIPHQIEKKQNAEVTAPYILRQDMLNSIKPKFWKGKKLELKRKN